MSGFTTEVLLRLRNADAEVRIEGLCDGEVLHKSLDEARDLRDQLTLAIQAGDMWLGGRPSEGN